MLYHLVFLPLTTLYFALHVIYYIYYDAAIMLYDLRRIYYALQFSVPSSKPLLYQRSIMLCKLYITYSMTLHIL